MCVACRGICVLSAFKWNQFEIFNDRPFIDYIDGNMQVCAVILSIITKEYDVEILT